MGLTVSPTSIPSGANLTCQWLGVSQPQAGAWIGLFKRENMNSVWVTRLGLNPLATSGSMIYPTDGALAPREYEMRMFASLYNLLATSPLFRVTTPLPVTISSVGVPATSGGVIKVTWANIVIPDPANWFGMFNMTGDYTTFLTKVYCNGSSGILPMTIPAVPPGNYKLKLYRGNPVAKLAESVFAVT